MSAARREALHKDRKVLLKDVEERDEDVGSVEVARHLVLPLPRTYGEAADWASRLKKGSRVYAMYPHTTSLYAATVIDNTTYCRGDDDIVVVEFDGEDPDATTGQVPACHIPARFVTLIPKEFAAQSSAAAAAAAAATAVGGGGNSTSKAGGAAGVGGTKRKASAVTSMSLGINNSNKRSNTNKSISHTDATTTKSGGGGYLDNISMDFNVTSGGNGLGFDALDLDFDKPLEDHEQDEGGFSEF